MIGKAQPKNVRWEARKSEDESDEHFADFKRPEPISRRLNRERVLNMARNARYLGRRSLSHLLLRWRRGKSQ